MDIMLLCTCLSVRAHAYTYALVCVCVCVCAHVNRLGVYMVQQTIKMGSGWLDSTSMYMFTHAVMPFRLVKLLSSQEIN